MLDKICITPEGFISFITNLEMNFYIYSGFIITDSEGHLKYWELSDTGLICSVMGAFA